MNKENREWIEGTLDIAQDDLVFQQPAMKSQGDGELCLRRAGDRQGEPLQKPSVQMASFHHLS